jgi:putative transposase
LGANEGQPLEWEPAGSALWEPAGSALRLVMNSCTLLRFRIYSAIMARPLRLEYDGAVHHVTIRGNQRGIIFQDNRDRERFIEKLAESVERYEIHLYLYTLMTNHVHMVLETPRGNLSQFMHRLQTAYTVFYNRKHNLSGHLLQGRFGSSVVNEDEHILKLSRYVHLNPVFIKANRRKSDRERIELLRQYPWSSYRSYIGRSKRLEFVDYRPVLNMMGGLKKNQASTYRRFVETGISDIDAALIEAKQRSRLCIGPEEFHNRVKLLYEKRVAEQTVKEDISFRHAVNVKTVDEVLTIVCHLLKIDREALQARQRNSFTRAIAAKALCDHCGMTQRQVGEVLGLRTGVAVSCQLRKLSEQIEKDKKLKQTIGQIRKMVIS